MMSKQKTIRLSIFVCLMLLAVLFFLSSKPVNNKNWVEQHRITTSIKPQGNLFHFVNIRDFRYSLDGAVKEAFYHNKSFNLKDLTAVWYGISHFGSPGLAHVFLSFEFNTNDYLVLSIEARLEQGESYSPLKGLFRQYEKIFVWGTEQDVIGLRSHIRKEPTHLYKLDLQPKTVRRLLLGFINESKRLDEAPQFYNTLLNNCMVGLAKYADSFSWFKAFSTIGIILPGYSDRVLFEENFLPQNISFEQQRVSSIIDPDRSSVSDPQFSLSIRH